MRKECKFQSSWAVTAIGVERIITAAIEQRHDDDGIIWPKSLTPFHVIVTITNMKRDDVRAAGEKL
jgi:prolyl-tRNA synthetase